MNKSAIVIGVKGLNLCLDEKKLLQEKKPLGVIFLGEILITLNKYRG